MPFIGEAARVVSLEVRGVVFLFEDGFPEKDEGPGDGDAIGSLPHFPSVTEGIPGILSGGAVEEAVLGRLEKALVTTFACGLEPHSLEPNAYREPFVEGQPDEGSYFAGTGVVPNPSHNLGGSGVAEAQTLDEVDDFGGGLRFPCVLVASLGGVAEEGGVSHVVFLLPMPVTWIPIEVGNKTGSENPV